MHIVHVFQLPNNSALITGADVSVYVAVQLVGKCN